MGTLDKIDKKVAHLMYMPLTGLGLYGGHRGNRWLKNRIKIFKQFVLPSLLSQTNKNFILWASARHEDRHDPIMRDFQRFLESVIPVVFTYSGTCFWDDKYPDIIAKERLVVALHGSLGDVINVIGDVDTVLMSIQPSDDCYQKTMVEDMQRIFSEKPDIQVLAYKNGYVMDYINGRIAEWNPATNPPFFTIKFPRDIFVDVFKHLEYTGPYKSHEYIVDYLKELSLYERGFLVGTHTSNISTVFNHPYTGDSVPLDVLENFGLQDVQNLETSFSIREWLFHKLNYQVKRKLRYWAEKNNIIGMIYNFIRS